MILPSDHICYTICEKKYVMYCIKETEKGVSEISEALEKIIMEEKERDLIYAVKNASKSFNVSEEDAVVKLGYSLSDYETAKRNQESKL